MVNCVDRTLKRIMNNDKPMGGKIVIFAGDFRQVLPIKIRANRSEIINYTIKYSDVWSRCKKFELVQNMRTEPGEIKFADYLKGIGNGTTVDENDEIDLPQEWLTKESLAKKIFGKCISEGDFDEMTKRAILCPYNEQVNEENDKVLSMMPGKLITFNGIDEVGDINKGERIRPETLYRYNAPSIPLHELKVKIGCTLILLRNMDISRGLCNGTRMKLVNVGTRLLECTILTGSNKGKTVYIPRIKIVDDKSFTFTLERTQFPVRLAFAMSINKSQGQTLGMVGINLEKDIFSHGQLYVALSRVRNWHSIVIKLHPRNKTRMTTNIVYKEIFADVQ
jgi:PIF1-like helicase/Helicase